MTANSTSSRLLPDYSKMKATLPGGGNRRDTSNVDTIKPSSKAGKAILTASASKLLQQDQDLISNNTANPLPMEESSLHSLTDPFGLGDDDEDNDDDSEEEEEELYEQSKNCTEFESRSTHRNNTHRSQNHRSMNDSELSLTPQDIILGGSQTDLQGSHNQHNNSQSSFSKNGRATSKRRIYKRRSRRSSSTDGNFDHPHSLNVDNNNNLHGSSRSLRQRRKDSSRDLTQSSPDFGVDFVVVVDPEQHHSNSQTMQLSLKDFESGNKTNNHKSNNNSKTMQLSLKDFLEQKQTDHHGSNSHHNHQRSKTKLLPGSTNADLCSDIQTVLSSRRGRGDRSRPTSQSRSRSPPPPSNTKTSSRKLPSRSYTDPDMVPVSSITIQDNSMNASSTVGSRRRLRDYSQSGSGTASRRRSSVTGSDPRLPRRIKSYDDSSRPLRSKAKGPIAKMVESQTARMNESMNSIGKEYSARNLTTSSRRFQTRERRHSKSFSHGVALTDGVEDNQDDDEYDEDIQEQMEHARRPRGGGRRLPPRCKSADGSAPRTTLRRHHTTDTSARNARSHTPPNKPTSGNSFVTGSRIRRITPGSASSGLSLSHSGLEKSLRSARSRSPVTSRERSGSPSHRYDRSHVSSSVRRTRSSD